MKTITTFTFLLLTGAALFFTGCKKDENQVTIPPPVTNEQEVVTSVRLVITDSITGNAIDTVVFLDPDGDGSGAPTVFDALQLQANTTYFMQVVLLNTLASPTDTISNEVAAEANDHQFFFTITGAALTHTYLDSDTNTPPLPVGLQNKLRTGAASTGTFQVILKHQPGIKNGSAATGDTDVDVTFSATIL